MLQSNKNKFVYNLSEVLHVHYTFRSNLHHYKFYQYKDARMIYSEYRDPPFFFSKGVTYNTKIPYNNKICVEKTKKYVTEYYFSGFISSGKQIVSKYGRFPLLLQNLKVGFIYVYRMVFRDYKFCNITGKSYVTGVLVYSYQ